MESRRRSLAKSFSWRITATVVTTVISWLITKQVALALSIGGIEFFAKIFLYYAHERAWSMFSYGKKSVDYQI